MSGRKCVGLVVVGFHSNDVWPGFFDSLRRSSMAPDTVVVVENSPEPPTLPKEQPPEKLMVLHRPDNPGYGAAINWGVQNLPDETDYVIACNPDLLFATDAISTLLESLAQEPRAGVAGPKILNSDGSLYPSARAFPGIRVGVGHALLGDVWKGNPWTRRYLGRYEGESPRIVDWLSGACMVFTREAFDSVRGFDQEYFMFVEDVDLCFRLKKHGWRSLYVPEAEVIHSGAHATGPVMRDMVKVHHESARKFLFRLYEGPAYWPLRQALRFGLWLRSLVAPLRY